MDTVYWKDQKGREIAIHTMSDKWLNNIRKKYRDNKIADPIRNEIKRRKLKRNPLNKSTWKKKKQ